MALDLASIFDDAQGYVMLSRVEDLEQVYILDCVKEDKLRPSAKALAELAEMNKRSINQNPIPWKQNRDDALKIASLNCMNLRNNFEDILKSTLVAFSETWLSEDENLEIDGYKSHCNSVGQGKGLAVYFKEDIFQHVIDIKKETSRRNRAGVRDPHANSRH